jgi:hypothetical protein
MEIDIPIITKGEKVILFLKLIRTREIIGLITKIIKITVGEAIVTMTQIKVRETIIFILIFTGKISGFKEGSIVLRNFWLKIVTLAPVSTNIDMGLLQIIVSI